MAMSAQMPPPPGPRQPRPTTPDSTSSRRCSHGWTVSTAGGPGVDTTGSSATSCATTKVPPSQGWPPRYSQPGGPAAPDASQPCDTEGAIGRAINNARRHAADPAQLVVYAQERCETAHSRYNLACYYLRTGNAAEAKTQAAVGYIALGGPESAAQALVDPRPPSPWRRKEHDRRGGTGTRQRTRQRRLVPAHASSFRRPARAGRVSEAVERS